MISEQADLVVVGAGVLGTFHAYFAVQRGLTAILLERDGYPSSASTRNFGMLPRTIVETAGPWADIVQDSATIYRSIQHHSDISVRETGSLYLASTPAERAVLEEFASLYAEQYACTYLDGGEARRRFGFVRESYCLGALLFPRDLSLDPSSMLRLLIPSLVETGLVHYVPRTTVVGVDATGSNATVVDSLGRRYTGTHVVLCTGADTRSLVPDTFEASGLQICKLQMMRTASQGAFRLPHSILSGLSIRRYPAFRACPSFAALAEERVDAGLLDFGVHLLLKSSPDGSIIVGDSHQYAPCSEPEELVERTDPAINEAILGYAQGMMDLPVWRIASLWNGYYLTHPDRPIFSHRVDDHVHIVTGIGGKGMSTGPGYARLSVESLFG